VAKVGELPTHSGGFMTTAAYGGLSAGADRLLAKRSLETPAEVCR